MPEKTGKSLEEWKKVLFSKSFQKHYEAVIKPATKTRIDLGPKLPDKELTLRLGNSGPFGTMCTHRVQLSQADQLDEEHKSWLKEAYEMST